MGLKTCCAWPQRKLFNLMGWLDAQLFRRVASMHYGGRGGAPSTEPYVDPGRDHWRKVVVSPASPPFPSPGSCAQAAQVDLAQLRPPAASSLVAARTVMTQQESACVGLWVEQCAYNEIVACPKKNSLQ